MDSIDQDRSEVTRYQLPQIEPTPNKIKLPENSSVSFDRPIDEDKPTLLHNVKPTVTPTESIEGNNGKANTTYKDLDNDQIDRATNNIFAGVSDMRTITSIDELLKVAEEEDVKKKIMEFFKENINPEDASIHAMAEKLGMDPDDLETLIYKILSSFLGQGKSKDYKGEYNPKELAMGVKIEQEHTNDLDLASRIAKDHLSEFGGGLYYTALQKMEEDLKKTFGNK